MFSFFGATVIQWPWCSRISNPSFSVYHFADFFASDTTRAIVVRRIMATGIRWRSIKPAHPPKGSCALPECALDGPLSPARPREVAGGRAPDARTTGPPGGGGVLGPGAG